MEKKGSSDQAQSTPDDLEKIKKDLQDDIGFMLAKKNNLEIELKAAQSSLDDFQKKKKELQEEINIMLVNKNNLEIEILSVSCKLEKYKLLSDKKPEAKGRANLQHGTRYIQLT